MSIESGASAAAESSAVDGKVVDDGGAPVAEPAADGIGQGPALRKAAIRGSVITIAGYGASAALRFGSNLLITRLLVPEQFGIMALVTVFLMGLQLFSDIGIGPNIIQNDRGNDPRFLNTAWTVQVLRGVTLWIVACVLAWPLSTFYGRRELFLLLPVTGFGAVIYGFESTRLFTQHRRLALGRVTAVELVTQLVATAVTLALAAVTRSVWALVFGALVSSVVRTVLSHTAIPGERNAFAWDPDARKALVKFGRWIFVSTALTFLAGQSDRLILGKLVSDARLGLYAIAANLAALPVSLIGLLSNRILYPITANARRVGGEDWKSVRSSHTRLLMVMAPIIAMGIVAGPAVVRLLYRRDYFEVGPLASWLTIGTWLVALSTSYSVVVMAAGMPKFLTFGAVTKTLFFTALVFPVTRRHGVTGVAVLVGLSELGCLLWAMIGARYAGIVDWAVDLAVTGAGVGYLFVCRLLFALAVGLSAGSEVAGVALVVVVTALVVLCVARTTGLLRAVRSRSIVEQRSASVRGTS